MAWYHALTDTITGFDREAHERGLEIDRQNQARNQELADRGLITQADVIASEENFREAHFDPDSEIAAAFDEGLEEGAANVTAVVTKPIEIAGKAAGSIIGALPAWLWLVGLAALAWFAWPVLGPLLGARIKRG